MKNNSSIERPKLVDISDIISSRSPLVSLVKKPAERLLGLERINNGYADAYVRHGSDELKNDFFSLICDSFGMDYTVDQQKYEQIPATGPVVVLSNHPYGLADGLLLGKLLTSIRKDVKIVANDQLEMCEEIRPWLITVDPFETAESKKRNLQGMREMLKQLRQGGMLGVFPAGSASSFSLKDRCVIDDQWNANIATLIRKTNATVVTLHFPGRNSMLFQGVSLFKKEARVAMLPRELKRHVKHSVSVEVSNPMAAASLNKFDSDQGLIDYLKLVTYCQGRKVKSKKNRVEMNDQAEGMQRIIDPLPAELVAAEVASLPERAELVRSGDFAVYVAEAEQIPTLLREVGRLREITFREVGEGTGKSCDLDEYDYYYKQLFLWDHKQQMLVGGYRIGETDCIIAQRGIKGLYNAQFFDFKAELFERMNPGLELGRSFIRREYQKKPLMLGLIWRGIGHFVATQPQYRYLFGVVSTSASYDSFSFRLIADFLKHHAMDDELASLIKAKNPLKGKALKPSEIEALVRQQLGEQSLSDLVSQVEDDNKGIPVLMRHYLKLNGKILGFNIDDDFGGVLDCMILVDLQKSPRRSLEKYMGKSAVEKIFGPESGLD